MFTLPTFAKKMLVPLFSTRVRTGFPSPAEDHLERMLDLNEFLIKKPSSTFIAKVEGDSMEQFNITEGTYLIVDRSLPRRQGSIVIVAVNGELTCKQLDIKGRRLLAGNEKFKPIEITEDMDTIIEGVVVWSIRNHL